METPAPLRRARRESDFEKLKLTRFIVSFLAIDCRKFPSTFLLRNEAEDVSYK